MEFDINTLFQALYASLKSNEGNRITTELVEGIIAQTARPWNEYAQKLEQEKKQEDGNTSDTD